MKIELGSFARRRLPSGVLQLVILCWVKRISRCYVELNDVVVQYPSEMMMVGKGAP